MDLKAIAAGRNPAAIGSDFGGKPFSDGDYSTVFSQFFFYEGFLQGGLC